MSTFSTTSGGSVGFCSITASSSFMRHRPSRTPPKTLHPLGAPGPCRGSLHPATTAAEWPAYSAERPLPLHHAPSPRPRLALDRRLHSEPSPPGIASVHWAATNSFCRRACPPRGGDVGTVPTSPGSTFF